MFYRALLLIFVSLHCYAGTYYSVFPFVETPIVQNNNWTNGKATGLDWSNCVSIAGFVHGTQTGAGSGGSSLDNYGDSTAILTGPWGSTQRVDAVVKVFAQSASTVGQEVELRLNTTISAHSIKGYEIDYSICDADPYVVIARWDGALGNFTLLTSVDTTHSAHDGDTVTGVSSNGVIYLYLNGTLIQHVADSTYTGGSPGIGFFLDNNNGTSSPGNATNFGFTSVMATDGIHSVTNACPTVALPDVQQQIYVATNNNDYVTVPSGTIAWTTNAYITNDIALLGSGPTNSVLIDEINRGYPHQGMIMWTMNTNGTASTNTVPRLYGFQFQGGVTNTDTTNAFDGTVQIGGNCFTFKEDNCLFTNLYNKSTVILGWVYGVASHVTNYLNFKQAFYIEHGSYGGSSSFGDASWSAPGLLGTSNFFFIEDSMFIEQSTATPGAVDMCGGGRVEIRNCYFTNCTPTTHGTESTGRTRSLRQYVAHNNTQWTDPGGAFSTTLGQYRGGTGLQYSNTYIGPYANGMTLTCYRMIYPFVYWWVANGTNLWDVNDATIYATGTHVGANLATALTANGSPGWTPHQWIGYTLRDVNAQTGSIITDNTANTVTYDLGGSSITGGTNMAWNSGDTFEIRRIITAIDEPGRGQGDLLANTPPTPLAWPNQALEPIYAWSNTLNGSLSAAAIGSGEYYPIGSGTNYFNGVVAPGLSDYPYPHPLVNSVIVQTPTGLKIFINGPVTIKGPATLIGE